MSRRLTIVFFDAGGGHRSAAEALKSVPSDGSRHPLLLIGNPHGLHAGAIVEAVEAGIRHLVIEKPVCVSTAEIARLRALAPVQDAAVCHGYRQQWGPRTIRRMIGTNSRSASSSSSVCRSPGGRPASDSYRAAIASTTCGPASRLPCTA